MDYNSIASEFIKYYYSVFEQDRSGLATLYRDQSMLTFEGNQFQGATPIVQKLTSLPFQKVLHKVSTLDAQPGPANALLVVVTGELLIDQETNATRFTQVFQLISEGATYWVLNDVFRLNYG
ncbi:9645_t:CDS:2 [Ambispora gerdemannii]|uniref:Nuclear transport factor 2 n=1 Tax=Ambispora gerdemannii TaxID=144530 RepID=A0A9N9GAN5_9GLOM|nr:9645_t:CDS:2 [Ambispora gerdemannii]